MSRPYFLHHGQRLARLAPVGRLGAALLLCLVTSATGVHGAVFHSRDEISALAFPDADRVESRHVFLTPEERERIERIAASELDSDLLTIYVGYRAGEVVGYALLDSHLVRTLTETLLIVLSREGMVGAIYVMAFHEPSEYLPSDRWLELLRDRPLSDGLRVGRDIVGITGATLSARAAVSSVRRALAIHAVVLDGR